MRVVVAAILLAIWAGCSDGEDSPDDASQTTDAGTMPPPNEPSAGSGAGSRATGGRAGSAGAGGAAGRSAGAGGRSGSGGAGGSGAGGGGSGGSGGMQTPPGDCVRARLLWSDGFEGDDYAAWTSQGYGAAWGNECQDTAHSTETVVSGEQSQRSEITCAYTAEGNVHRGYGGIQFSGDEPLPAFTNAGVGIDAPYGVVNTLWIRLDTETVFEGGRWVSFFTANSDCDWNGADQVLGFGIEDSSYRLAAAHYQWNAGGTREFEPNAPTLPRGQWVRVTTYVNFHDDEMHIWQDGQSVQHVTFDRALQTICHFHWGLYASGDNTDIVLFEDDNSIWKLEQPWTDFSVEPYFGQDIAVCN